jgi:hypothetical protein
MEIRLEHKQPQLLYKALLPVRAGTFMAPYITRASARI